jgi:hypothetical protein
VEEEAPLLPAMHCGSAMDAGKNLYGREISEHRLHEPRQL